MPQPGHAPGATPTRLHAAPPLPLPAPSNAAGDAQHTDASPLSRLSASSNIVGVSQQQQQQQQQQQEQEQEHEEEEEHHFEPLATPTTPALVPTVPSTVSTYISARSSGGCRTRSSPALTASGATQSASSVQTHCSAGGSGGGGGGGGGGQRGGATRSGSGPWPAPPPPLHPTSPLALPLACAPRFIISGTAAPPPPPLAPSALPPWPPQPGSVSETSARASAAGGALLASPPPQRRSVHGDGPPGREEDGHGAPADAAHRPPQQQLQQQPCGHSDASQKHWASTTATIDDGAVLHPPSCDAPLPPMPPCDTATDDHPTAKSFTPALAAAAASAVMLHRKPPEAAYSATTVATAVAGPLPGEHTELRSLTAEEFQRIISEQLNLSSDHDAPSLLLSAGGAAEGSSRVGPMTLTEVLALESVPIRELLARAHRMRRAVAVSSSSNVTAAAAAGGSASASRRATESRSASASRHAADSGSAAEGCSRTPPSVHSRRRSNNNNNNNNNNGMWRCRQPSHRRVSASGAHAEQLPPPDKEADAEATPSVASSFASSSSLWEEPRGLPCAGDRRRSNDGCHHCGGGVRCVSFSARPGTSSFELTSNHSSTTVSHFDDSALSFAAFQDEDERDAPAVSAEEQWQGELAGAASCDRTAGAVLATRPSRGYLLSPEVLSLVARGELRLPLFERVHSYTPRFSGAAAAGTTRESSAVSTPLTSPNSTSTAAFAHRPQQSTSASEGVDAPLPLRAAFRHLHQLIQAQRQHHHHRRRHGEQNLEEEEEAPPDHDGGGTAAARGGPRATAAAATSLLHSPVSSSSAYTPWLPASEQLSTIGSDEDDTAGEAPERTGARGGLPAFAALPRFGRAADAAAGRNSGDGGAAVAAAAAAAAAAAVVAASSTDTTVTDTTTLGTMGRAPVLHLISVSSARGTPHSSQQSSANNKGSGSGSGSGSSGAANRGATAAAPIAAAQPIPCSPPGAGLGLTQQLRENAPVSVSPPSGLVSPSSACPFARPPSPSRARCEGEQEGDGEWALRVAASLRRQVLLRTRK